MVVVQWPVPQTGLATPVRLPALVHPTIAANSNPVEARREVIFSCYLIQGEVIHGPTFLEVVLTTKALNEGGGDHIKHLLGLYPGALAHVNDVFGLQLEVGLLGRQNVGGIHDKSLRDW